MRAAIERRGTAWLPWVLGLAALTPVVRHWSQFRGLFWFGDELGLMDEISHLGFWPWLGHAFAENFVPAFKLLWGGVLFGFHGDYRAELAAIWLTHAANVALLAGWMRQAGFTAVATAFATLTFGFAATNIETLTWAVQWSQQLAVLFFLLCGVDGGLSGRRPRSHGHCVRLILECLASAWSFSRGVLTGPVAAFQLIRQGQAASRRRRWLLAALLVLPSLVTAALIVTLAPNNHSSIWAHPAQWATAASFSAWYLTANPFLPIWSSLAPSVHLNEIGITAVIVAGTLKFALLAGGYATASIWQRRLLSALGLFDVGYAVLLGLGRSDADIHLVMSSRYQYNALICTLPFLAVLLERGLSRLRLPRGGLSLTGAALVGIAVYLVNLGWSRQLPGWVAWRGAGTRRVVVASPPNPAATDLPGNPYMTDGRARELRNEFRLH